MRPKNFTLTAPQVHRCAAVVLQDHLKLGDHGPKCRASLLFTLLLYAAARITSLSDACKTLRDAPSDEAARLALIATLPDFAELQRTTQRRLGRQLAQDLAPQPAAHGRRSGPDPLSWPAAARPRRDLPLRGQKRDQPLPRLRHALRHPQRLPLHRGIDPGLPGRTPGGGLEAPSASGRPSRDSLPLAAFGPRLLQCGGDPLSPGGPPSVPDACDLPRPPARRSARTERDQRLLDLAEQRLRDLYQVRKIRGAPVPRIVSIGQDRLGVGTTPGA